jgi:hypothetical protein
MFLTELSPLVKELTQQPIAFLGGLTAGLLRLSLTDDPVKGWLDSHWGDTVMPQTADQPNGKAGPQSINID